MVCANRDSLSVPGSFVPPFMDEVGSSCTIYCDLDGPLIDVSGRYYKTYRLAIDETIEHYLREGKELQIRPMHQERFWHLKLERIPDVDIAQMTGFNGEEIDYFLTTVRALVNQPHLLEEDRLQPWATEALERMTSNGIRLSLVTLRRHEQAVQVLKRFGLYHFFTAVQGTTDEFAAYNNYAHVKSAMLSKLMNSNDGIQSTELTWMVGDTEADIQSAKAVGISSIAVRCGMRSQTYLQRLEPTYIVIYLQLAADLILNKIAIVSN